MSKALLEMDMPDNCLMCVLSDYTHTEESELLNCVLLNIEIENYLERHCDCPLKEIEDT
ncbi:hypothetical protein [Ruminiclostridium cellobioparum]|uniref:hypothetical protein n=1 Tax=Ruminiclostridium cellobioparum TaxID=29355 RepID=UPI0028A63020|nr:hypothetical protein [Ruminiclostridium cellobioparum]